MEKVGNGAFGEVWKAIAKGLLKENEETIVAVKQAKNFGKCMYSLMFLAACIIGSSLTP